MNDMPDTINAGAVQFDVICGDTQKNLAAATAGIRRLAEKRCQVAVLPELWSCGFGDPSMIQESSEKTPAVVEKLQRLATAHRMLIAGSLPEKIGNRIYNTMVVVDADGAIAGQYRKVHLFSYINEDKTFSPGNQAVVCQTSCGPIGVMICFDLRFPELCRTLAIKGARMILISAQWPRSRIQHWDTLLAARAIENQVFVVASNRVGRDGNLMFNGHSRILSPDGIVLATVNGQPGEAFSRINFTEIETLKGRFDPLHERMPSVYKS
jgi:predicted amidohydrolase